MEKKRKLSTKIAALLLLLTVISCCFLGSTFAKYTSSTTGTATTGVALWKVNGVSENGTTSNNYTITITNLSPDHDATYGSGNVANTTSTTEYTITNESEVDALISVAVGTITPTYVSGKDTGTIGTTGVDVGVAFAKVFTLSVTIDNSQNDSLNQLPAKSSGSKSLKVQVSVSWNTLYGEYTEAVADEIDTYFGMYLQEIELDFTITATQASTVNS